MTETPEQSLSWGSWITGLALGVVAGLTVALLYAPQSGQETREELIARLDDLRERVDETTRNLTEAAKMRFEETRADLSQAIEATRVTASERAAELRRQAGLDPKG